MARNTKMKLAAVVTAVVATLGVTGASAAVSTDAGHSHITHTSVKGGGDSWCC